MLNWTIALSANEYLGVCYEGNVPMHKNGCVNVGDTDMYYVAFGEGKKNLVVLPGLSDGLWTVNGKAWLLAGTYKKFFKDYTVYMFSSGTVKRMGRFIFMVLRKVTRLMQSRPATKPASAHGMKATERMASGL